ncbi:MAG: tRNA adenosine(34) deaminase TadA [Lachnospiraceae bacterium]|nr:tRNA adenosine(34) deaminase TadA [Lachnospiraceae bacterium]
MSIFHIHARKEENLNNDSFFMHEALKEAKKAEKYMEVPIGCVITRNGKIIARGHNTRNRSNTCFGHAEIAAIRIANRKVKDWRLEDCTLYVTLEPCQMCAGAIVQSRINKVVIGAMNPKAGCAGSILNLLEMSQFNHQCIVTRGVLEEECSSMLTSFFKKLRAYKKGKKCSSKQKD